MPRVLLGIDPGTSSGLAEADATTGALASLKTCGPLKMVRALDAFAADPETEVMGVWLEDSRGLPIYARNRAANRGQRDRIARGVGHTDCLTGLYLALCESHGWPVTLCEPGKVAKWDADELRRLTGWTGRTSEHARDAARLVFGRRVSAPPRRVRGHVPPNARTERGGIRGTASLESSD